MRAFIGDIISNFKKDPRVVAQQQLARTQSWGFKSRQQFEGDSISLLPFELFKGKRGKRRVATLSMTSARLAGSFRVYDYLYYGDLGEKATTVFEFYAPKLSLSSFMIRPKGTLTAMKEIFISPELLFATTPEFNERYEIIVKDREAIKLDLNEEFLDEVGDVLDWTYEGNSHFLIAYQTGKRIPSTEIKAAYLRFEQTCERLINGRSSHDWV